ncbi:hypothetical protein CPB85DRAFT_754012 [Mucidula mucida]|nr:hypothetical protein CPB85DRAFT_754012 [Mucidula mucida]
MVDKSGHRLKDFVQENMKMMKDMTDTRPPTITRFGDVAPPVVSLFAPRYQSSAEPAPTESSNAELTSLSLAAVPLPRAPMPELSDELSSMRRAKIENVMKEVFTDPDRLEELQNQLTEFVLTAPAREAVKTTQSRQRVMSYYFAMMERMAPRIRSYERFYIAVALKYIPLLLPFMVEAVRPRPGHTVLKSRTVVGWLGIVVHLLLQYTQDPTNNRRCGLEALSQHSLYDTLQKVVFRLVREKGLDRYYDHRIYYGQMEVRLMIEAALAHATPTNCMVKVNSLLKILLPFYLTSRPSTLGLACKEYTSLHAYLALGHLKIYHLADGAFQIDVLLLTFKQYFKEHGSSQDWTLYQTQRTHNVPFDVVDYLVSYLFMAGAFEKKFETLDELLNDKDAELHIDPSRRDEPLFPAMTAGGRAFEEPLRPATAHSLSATCHTLAVDAGLVAVGIQSLRRGSADYYAMVKGKQYAKTALNHVKEDTFDGHYDKGTRNMNPVADRLGEDVPEGSRHPKALDSNPRRSVAVRAWADLLLVDPSINSSSSEEQINEAKVTLFLTLASNMMYLVYRKRSRRLRRLMSKLSSMRIQTIKN